MFFLIVAVLTSIFALGIIYALWPNADNTKTIPEPEDKWPLLGHSPLLISQTDHDQLHYELGNKFKKDGMYKIRHNLRK